MECATDILNKFLEDKAKASSSSSKDKRKTLSSKDAAEQRAQELVQSAAFAALRTRAAVDSALWEVRTYLSCRRASIHIVLASLYCRLLFEAFSAENLSPRGTLSL